MPSVSFRVLVQMETTDKTHGIFLQNTPVHLDRSLVHMGDEYDRMDAVEYLYNTPQAPLNMFHDIFESVYIFLHLKISYYSPITSFPALTLIPVLNATGVWLPSSVLTNTTTGFNPFASIFALSNLRIG